MSFTNSNGLASHFKTNTRPQCCAECEIVVEPGLGRLDFVPDAHDNDDFDRVGTHAEAAHWDVYCLDTAACQARTLARKEAQRVEREALRAERAKAAQARAKVAEEKLSAWNALTAGLVRTESRPEHTVRTCEVFDNGQDVTCEKILLADGSEGWRVSWIGDMDGCYYLVPQAVKETAEAEKTRLHRVYQWWRPGAYKADSYPGPGVPVDELTDAEREEVALRTTEKLAVVRADWVRSVQIAFDYSDAAKVLKSIGATVEIVIPEPAFTEFCAVMAATDTYSKARDALRLEVTLKVTLPATCYTARGKLKAAAERSLLVNRNTGNRFVGLVLEVVAP